MAQHKAADKAVDRFTLRDLFASKRRSFDDKVPVLRRTLQLLEEHGYIARLHSSWGVGRGFVDHFFAWATKVDLRRVLATIRRAYRIAGLA